MNVHPSDWAIWEELVASIEGGQKLNVNSEKRKRSLLAIAKMVAQVKKEGVFEVKA